MKKKILLSIVAILIIIQFFRPEQNDAAELITAYDISKKHSIPENVHQILIEKCYDCHSNKTNYPWYSNIQPVAWWMSDHIDEGKRELNFSEFSTYPTKKANHKIHEIAEEINEGEMPLTSYTVIHPNTKITESDRAAVNDWIKSLGLPEEEHR
jgi:Haem-binding domain